MRDVFDYVRSSTPHGGAAVSSVSGGRLLLMSSRHRDRRPLARFAKPHRAVAETYGLGPSDFAHILSALPVFARKRPAFFAYLLQRLDEWGTGGLG